MCHLASDQIEQLHLFLDFLSHWIALLQFIGDQGNLAHQLIGHIDALGPQYFAELRKWYFM